MAGSLIKYVNKDWADKSGLPELDFAAQDTFTNPSMLYTMNSISPDSSKNTTRIASILLVCIIYVDDTLKVAQNPVDPFI